MERPADILKAKASHVLQQDQGGSSPAIHAVQLQAETQQVPASRDQSPDADNARKYTVVGGYEEHGPFIPEKTIMVVGATGAGKTTMIKAMLNYIAGVTFEDPFRLDLLEEEFLKGCPAREERDTASQTDWISCYTIPLMRNSRITFRLSAIDTPGFADTRGKDRDKSLKDKFRNFFTEEKEYGIRSLDAVCFVAKASDGKLSEAQAYVFDSLMGVFGKDVAENIVVFATFGDTSEPLVLNAMKEANVPFRCHYRFNNAALYAPNAAGHANPVDKYYWDNVNEAFADFFEELTYLPRRCLTLTKEVLIERTKLEATYVGLEARIRDIKQKEKVMQEHRFHCSKLRDENNWTFESIRCQVHTIDIPSGKRWATNCTVCKQTCHTPCWGFSDFLSSRCDVMDGNGNCKVCVPSCSAAVHESSFYKYERREEVSMVDGSLKELYLTAGREYDDVAEAVRLEIKKCQKDREILEERVRCSISRLNEIALKGPTQYGEIETTLKQLR